MLTKSHKFKFYTATLALIPAVLSSQIVAGRMSVALTQLGTPPTQKQPTLLPHQRTQRLATHLKEKADANPTPITAQSSQEEILVQAQRLEKKGEFNQAIALYRRALENYKKFTNRQGEAATLWILGNLYVQLGTSKENAPISPLTSQQSSYYSKALNYLESSLKISQELKDSWLELKSLISIILIDGSFFEETGKFQAYIKQASLAIEKTNIRTDTHGSDPAIISNQLEYLDKVAAQNGVNPQDGSFISGSRDIQKNILNQSGLSDSSIFRSFVDGRILLYKEVLSKPNLENLENLYVIEEMVLRMALSEKLSESENQTYFDEFQYSTNMVISFNQQGNLSNQKATHFALDTILSRKGKILDVLQRATLALPSQEARLNAQKAVVRKAWAVFSWYYTHDWIHEGKFSNKTEQRERNRNIDFFLQIGKRLYGVVNQLGGSLSYEVKEGLSDWESVQKALPNDTALVEFVKYRPYSPGKKMADRWEPARYAAYLLFPTGQPQGFDLGTTSEIDALLVHFRQLLGDRKSDVAQIKAIGQQLEAKLMRPIRAKLGNTRRLFLSPDNQLNLLPFDALVDKNNKYLVETYSISYLNSGRDLLQLKYLRTEQPRQKTLIVADPDFSSRLSSAQKSGRRSPDTDLLNCCDRLAWTTKEAENLRKLMPESTVLTQREATKEAIQQAKAPRILHIATHGFFLPERVPPLYAQAIPNANTPVNFENPLLRSGLALAGFDPKSGRFEGALSALEVSSLDLLGTELVVLSACQTGVGEIKNGEGVYGLRRAFSLAGAKSLLLSLWKVDDQATYSLMTSYYSRLLQGEGRDEALHNTQRKMLSLESFSHPYYWAGFFQAGDWKPLPGVAPATTQK